MKELRYVENYMRDEPLLNGLDTLALDTFGIRLAPWARDGHWDGGYVPHSIAEGNRILSNVSTTCLRMTIRGKVCRVIQIGSVMTAADQRGQGLSRRLLERVLREYRPVCDFLFLYANETVLEFYSKFGFLPYAGTEVVFPARQPLPAGFPLRRLDIAREEDHALLARLAKSHVPVSKELSVEGNESLIWFYLGYQCPELAYYIGGMDAIVVLRPDGDKLILLDVLAGRPFSLPELLASVRGEEGEITTGFQPDTQGTGLSFRFRPNGEHLFCLPGFPGEAPALVPFLGKA